MQAGEQTAASPLIAVKSVGAQLAMSWKYMAEHAGVRPSHRGAKSERETADAAVARMRRSKGRRRRLERVRGLAIVGRAGDVDLMVSAGVEVG